MRKTVMVILVLVAVAAVSAGAVYGGRGEMGGRGGHRFPDLTEEQRGKLQELVSGMRETGASREEIHGAVSGLFESWGIEAPEMPENGGRGEGRGEGPGHGPGPGFMDQLTEEQRQEVDALVSGMREAGASREEIHAAVRGLLESWGIELPEPPEGPGHGPGPAFMDQLTEEQRQEVHALVSGLREAGASREEVRAAVHALLESWGIELPEECRNENGENETLMSPAEGETATWGEIKGDYR